MQVGDKLLLCLETLTTFKNWSTSLWFTRIFSGFSMRISFATFTDIKFLWPQSKTLAQKAVCVEPLCTQAEKRLGKDCSTAHLKKKMTRAKELALIFLLSLPLSLQQSAHQMYGIAVENYALPCCGFASFSDVGDTFLCSKMSSVPRTVQVLQLRFHRAIARPMRAEQRREKRVGNSTAQPRICVCRRVLQKYGK